MLTKNQPNVSRGRQRQKTTGGLHSASQPTREFYHIGSAPPPSDSAQTETVFHKHPTFTRFQVSSLLVLDYQKKNSTELTIKSINFICQKDGILKLGLQPLVHPWKLPN